jgi:hypothetical protein
MTVWALEVLRLQLSHALSFTNRSRLTTLSTDSMLWDDPASPTWFNRHQLHNCGDGLKPYVVNQLADFAAWQLLLSRLCNVMND